MPLFTDQLGEVVQLDNLPSRIVSLVPSITELLFDLGLGDRVVGVTEFCVHPQEAKTGKVRLSGPMSFTVEEVEALQPDLILGNREENPQEIIEALQATFPVWMADIRTLEDALAMMVSIGQMTGKTSEARALAEEIRTGMEALQQYPSHRVAYFIWRKPYRVAAGNTFINEMLKLCSLENVFADLNRYPEVSIKQIKDANPNLLMLSSDPFPFSDKHGEAFAEQGIKTPYLLVDGEMFCWTGSRLKHAKEYFVALREAI